MLDTKLQSRKRRHVVSLVIVCIALALTGWLIFNRQYVVDQLTVWQYEPSSEVAAMAERTTMSTTGRFLFYASQPALDGQQAFNQNCTRKEQNMAVLGCYDGHRIFVYNISNPKLDGIREVTAAHEMLHAAYQRLSSSERQKVNDLLEVEYDKLKDDTEFAARVAFYARTEPGERHNELHAVIGTEIMSLSPVLETHYKKYFTDRAALVELHAKYASVFSDLQDQAKQLSAQLTALGDSIETGSNEYNKAVSQLNDDIALFNNRANGNDFATRYEFDSARAALVSRADDLNTQRTTINGNVTTYNSLRDQLSQVSLQSDALSRSIDSSLSPAPSL